jgi:hypothetical protein
MPLFALTNAYLSLGAMTALAFHIWAGRLATAEPDELCDGCREIRDDMSEVLGAPLRAMPAVWVLLMVIVALFWPPVALFVTVLLIHRCTREES